MATAESSHVWQRRLVREAKGLEPATDPRMHEVALVDAFGQCHGALRPLDARHASDSKIIDVLTRWRTRHMECFLTQFTATSERTARWLNHYLRDDTRLLWMVYEHGTSHPLGHLGFCNLTGRSAELDNVLRGEPCQTRSLMFLAQVWLLHQTFSVLKVEFQIARVLAHNERALDLNRRVGFRPTGCEGLRRTVQANGDIAWIPIASEPLDPSEPSLALLRVEREEFRSAHPWLPAFHGENARRIA